MIQAVGTAGIAMSTMQRAGPPPAPKEVYSKIDGDQSGTLNLDELQAMLDALAAKMGDTDRAPSAEELMQKLDTDGDGEVSAAEFEAGRPEGPPPGPPPDAARQASATAATDVTASLGLLAYLANDETRDTAILDIKV